MGKNVKRVDTSRKRQDLRDVRATPYHHRATHGYPMSGGPGSFPVPPTDVRKHGHIETRKPNLIP